MSEKRIFGLETEYGVMAVGGKGASIKSAVARKTCAPRKLGGQGTAWAWLPNGARCYLDVGEHPEYSTPEVTNPYDLLCRDRAGDHLIEILKKDAWREICEENEEKLGAIEVRILKNNYDNHGNSYGSHENYQLSRDLAWPTLASSIVDHLSTRMLYTGAGAVVEREGVSHFELSARSRFMTAKESSGSTSNRGIINTRDEALCDSSRWRRLHVTSGDANMSQWAGWMKVATTHLVLRVIEEKGSPTIRLYDPLATMKYLSRDVDLQELYACQDQKKVRAVDVQEAWLEAAWNMCSKNGATDWEQQTLEWWEEALNALKNNPTVLKNRVEWLAKKELLDQAAKKFGSSYDDARIKLLDLFWHDINPEKGLARRLERSGKLMRLCEDDDVVNSMVNPPEDTRASIRGRYVRWAGERGLEVDVNWDRLGRKKPGASIKLPEAGVLDEEALKNACDDDWFEEHMPEAYRLGSEEIVDIWGAALGLV